MDGSLQRASVFQDPAFYLEVAACLGSARAFSGAAAATHSVCRLIRQFLKVPHLHVFVGGGGRCSSEKSTSPATYFGIRVNIGTGTCELLPSTCASKSKLAGAIRVVQADRHVFVLTEIVLRQKKGFALEVLNSEQRIWEEKVPRQQGEPDVLVQGDGCIFISCSVEVEEPHGTRLTPVFYCYSFGAERLEVLPSIPTSRCSGGACVVEGVLYVAGGYRFPDGSGELPILAAFERFDPVQGAWEQLPPMPTPRLKCELVAADGCVYAVGGLGPHGSLGALERFSLSDGFWSRMASLPKPRSSLQVLPCRGYIYAFGGSAEGDSSASSTALQVDRWDPRTGRWFQLPSIVGVKADVQGTLGVSATCHQDRLFLVYTEASQTAGGRAERQVVVEEYDELVERRQRFCRLPALHGHLDSAVAVSAE